LDQNSSQRIDQLGHGPVEAGSAAGKHIHFMFYLEGVKICHLWIVELGHGKFVNVAKSHPA